MKYTDLTREQLERIKEHAPELLEALEMVMRAISHGDPIPVDTLQYIINKAKGE